MKKIVSATLAGALAVGMVPAMALADDAIELQATVDDDMASAKIAEYAGGLTSGHKFVYNGEEQKLVPTKVVGSVSGIEYEVTSYKYIQISGSTPHSYYKIDADTALLNGGTVANPTNIGKYAVIAYVDGATDGAQFVGTFEIVGKSLADVEVYQSTGLATDTLEDTKFVWTPAGFYFADSADPVAGDLNLKLGGKALKHTDYSVVAYYDQDNVEVSYPWAPGTYTAVIEGEGSAYAGQTAKVSFKIEKLDLSSASVTFVDDEVFVASDQPDIDVDYGYVAGEVLVEGTDIYEDYGYLKAAHSATGEVLGPKTLTVSANAGMFTYDGLVASDYVVGQAKVNYITVAAEVGVDAQYGSDNFEGKSITVGAAAGTTKFDESFIGNVVTTAGKKLTADQYDLVVKRYDTTVPGNYVDATVADLKNAAVAGEYHVWIKVDPSVASINYAFAGETENYMTVVVDNGEIVDATVAYTRNNQLVTSVSCPYDGADVMDEIGIVVKNDEGVAVSADDYEVVITKENVLTSKWDVVDAIVDAGSYKVAIKSNKYDVTAADLTVNVTAANVKANLFSQVDDGDTYDYTAKVLYTGEEIDPIANFTVDFDINGDKVTNAKDVIEVADGAYTLKIKTYVDMKGVAPKVLPTTFEAAGTYTFEIVPAVDNVNYAFETKTFTVVITDQNVFVDVPSDAWYADEVYEVAAAGIMGGYASSKFGPNDNAERQDLAVMILRMLEPSTNLNNIKEILGINGKDYSKLISMVTGLTGELDLPFTDAKGNAYYSAAVWYCNENGIMTGYANSDEFGVGDAVTREQVAATLYRIDQAGFFGNGLPMFASNLDAYADADEVSKYAVEAMEWAVENGIMGVNTAYLNPGEEITRAELAAMFVRFADYNAGKLQA